MTATASRAERAARVQRRLAALVMLAALATIPLTIAEERGARGGLVTAADWAIWGVFLVELVVMLCLVEDRREHARRNLLAIAVVVLSFPLLPDLLQLARLTRLARLGSGLRLLRLVLAGGRGLQGARAVFARRGVVYVSSIAGLVLCLGGGLLAVLEPERVEGGGFAAGLWWAVVTASTVGYGDIAPSTTGGRIVALVVMLAGIGLVSTLAASITAYFVEQDETDKLADVSRRLEGIEAELKLLRALLEPPERPGRRG